MLITEQEAKIKLLTDLSSEKEFKLSNPKQSAPIMNAIDILYPLASPKKSSRKRLQDSRKKHTSPEYPGKILYVIL